LVKVTPAWAADQAPLLRHGLSPPAIHHLSRLPPIKSCRPRCGRRQCSDLIQTCAHNRAGGSAAWPSTEMVTSRTRAELGICGRKAGAHTCPSMVNVAFVLFCVWRAESDGRWPAGPGSRVGSPLHHWGDCRLSLCQVRATVVVGRSNCLIWSSV